MRLVQISFLATDQTFLAIRSFLSLRQRTDVSNLQIKHGEFEDVASAILLIDPVSFVKAPADAVTGQERLGRRRKHSDTEHFLHYIL